MPQKSTLFLTYVAFFWVCFICSINYYSVSRVCMQVNGGLINHIHKQRKNIHCGFFQIKYFRCRFYTAQQWLKCVATCLCFHFVEFCIISAEKDCGMFHQISYVWRSFSLATLLLGENISTYRFQQSLHGIKSKVYSFVLRSCTTCRTGFVHWAFQHIVNSKPVICA